MAINYPLRFIVQAVDKSTGSLARINARMAKLTEPIRVPLRKLSNAFTAFSQEAGLPDLVDRFKGVGGSVKSVAQEAESLGKKLAGVTLLAGGLAFGLIHSSVEAGDKLGEVSQRLGLTATAFAKYRFSAAQADVEDEQFISGMDRLNRSLGELHAGGGPLLGFLNKVSPTLARQVRGTKSTEEAVGLLTKSFTKVQDPARRAAFAAAVFGKGNAQMGQWLGQGTAALEAQGDRFLVLAGNQDEFARRSGDADNAMRETQVALLGLRNTAVAGFLPAVSAISTALADFLAKNREGLARWAENTGAAITAWVKGGGLERLGASLSRIATTIGALVDRLGGLEGVAKIVAVAMSAKLAVSVGGLIVSLGQLGGSLATVAIRLGSLLFGPVVAAIGTFVTALMAGTPVVGAFNAVLAANPIGLVILAIAALAGAVYLIYKNWGPISGFFSNIWQTVSDTTVQYWGAIRTFFSGLWDDITGFFTRAWERIKPIVDVMMKVAALSPIGLAVDAGKAAADWWQGRDQTGGGAAAALPSAAMAGGGGETRVVVDFNGMPRGARVTSAGGDAPVDLAVGYSMLGP